MPAFLFRIKHNTPPSLRMNPMPVSHRRFLTSTRLSRQCRPNACDFFHVKTVTTKPHCHDTDLPRSSELQSYAYAILPPPQPSVMAVPLYYISLIMLRNISSIKKRMFPHYFSSKYRRAISTMSKTKKATAQTRSRKK